MLSEYDRMVVGGYVGASSDYLWQGPIILHQAANYCRIDYQQEQNQRYKE
jgi:hypothetical protein